MWLSWLCCDIITQAKSRKWGADVQWPRARSQRQWWRWCHQAHERVPVLPPAPLLKSSALFHGTAPSSLTLPPCVACSKPDISFHRKENSVLLKNGQMRCLHRRSCEGEQCFPLLCVPNHNTGIGMKEESPRQVGGYVYPFPGAALISWVA